MGLAVCVTLWALATGFTLYAVQRWHLSHWDPQVVGVVESDGGPYRTAPSVPRLRYGAPWPVRAAATLAIGVFWAFLPALWLSTEFGFAWLLLAAFPVGGAAILLRSEARGMVIVLILVWVQVAALMFASAAPPMDPLISPRYAIWATGPVMGLVGAASLIRRGPNVLHRAVDGTPGSIRWLRRGCLLAWLVHLPLSALHGWDGVAALGFFLGLPIVIGALLLTGRSRGGVGAMFGLWIALALVAGAIAAATGSPSFLLPVAITGPGAFAVMLKNV
jgi:hypothetical protein